AQASSAPHTHSPSINHPLWLDLQDLASTPILLALAIDSLQRHSVRRCGSSSSTAQGKSTKISLFILAYSSVLSRQDGPKLLGAHPWEAHGHGHDDAHGHGHH
ncbi:unnamed protein product, partial [Rhizoctonia solani]